MKSEKPLINNALELAQNVAEVILDNCYAKSVDDILLFGSTLTREAHDIDLLMIHHFYPLEEFGKFTKYQDGCGLVLDLEAKIENGRYKASLLLKKMGSPEFIDYYEASNEIMDALEAEIPKIRNDEDYTYEGIMTLPYLGQVSIDPKTEFYLKVLETIDDLFKERFEQRMVVEKVKKYFADKNLDMNEVLDLHVMDREVLSPVGENDRKLAIQQSRDPTFWYTVLTVGRLYDRGTRTFTIPVEEKYPQAIELFKP